MTAPPDKMTNPGRSENLAKHQSLAEAIASNLTAGREEAERATNSDTQDQKSIANVEPIKAPEKDIEIAESEIREEVASQDAGTVAEETSREDSLRYTLDDFASAAELPSEELAKLLDVEVSSNDGTQRISLHDVIRGYRYEAANTRRAQEIAEERRKVDTRLGELNQLHDQATAVLQSQWSELDTEQNALDQQYRAVNWAGLQAKQDGSYADTEAQFSRARSEIQARRDRLQNAYANVQQQRQELAQRQQSEVLPKARERMLDLIPEWRDQTRFETESAEVARFVTDRYGFKAEDIAGVTDPRVIQVLHRLWTLERQAGDVPIAQKKVAKAPKVVKPGQQKGQQNAREAARQKIANRLRKSGSRNALAELILHDARSASNGNRRI